MAKLFETDLWLENVWKNIWSEVWEVEKIVLTLAQTNKRNNCLEFHLKFAHLSQTRLGWLQTVDCNECLEKVSIGPKKVLIKTWHFLCSRHYSRHFSLWCVLIKMFIFYLLVWFVKSSTLDKPFSLTLISLWQVSKCPWHNIYFFIFVVCREFYFRPIIISKFYVIMTKKQVSST